MRLILFFFQAEDGIRDDLVTGVQTCALPILDNTKPLSNANISTALPEGAKGMKLSFIVTGNYQQINTFLKDIEHLVRPIILDNVSLSSEGGEVTLTLNMNGRVTYQ